MKKFTKICLILAAVAAGLGIIGVIAGMALGATPDEFLDIARDESRQYMKVEEHFVEIHREETAKPDGTESEGNKASEEGTESKDGKKPQKETPDSDTQTYDREIPDSLAFGNADTVDFELELGAGEINLYLYEGEQILLSCKDLNDISKYMNIETDGKTVSIEDTRTYYVEGWELEVYLPNRTFRDIDLELGAAEVYMEALNAEEITLELGAGTLKADRIVAGRSADLNVGAGEMTISSLEGNDLDLDCGIGTLKLTLQGKEADYTYMLDCGAGTIQLGASTYSGLGRETRVDGGSGAAKYVDVDCGIGEISIAFEEE